MYPFFSQAELSRFVEEKLMMHKRSARNLHLNGSVKSGGTSLFGGGGSMVLPTANNAGTIFKVRSFVLGSAVHTHAPIETLCWHLV